MNKSLGTIAFLGILLTISSCKDKLQTTNAEVKKLTDTTFVATIDKYDISFDSKDARYDNGAIMEGDSVTIHYVGNLRDKKVKAMLVKLLPREGNIVEVKYDPTKDLKTKEISPEELKKLKEGVKYSKSH